MPTVAIVGRPNVGKSAIFNRLAGRKIAIVHDQPGVTRDRLAAPCKATATACSVVDTGGIGASIDDDFSAQVEVEADVAMGSADLILFVVDAREGLTSVDEALAGRLRGAKPEVILVVNKADHGELEQSVDDFASLGFGSGLAVSAEHGRNFRQLVAAIDDALEPLARDLAEAAAETAAAGLRLAIVGKPNAGKSSLINAILKDSRTIVSEVAGTTRDAIDLPYERDGERFTLIDTAGLRPRSRRDSPVEVFSAIRSEKAIRRADLCLLVVDLAAGISAQDRRIARMILEEKKPCLVVLNKFDLFHPDAPRRARLEEAADQLRRELFFLDYAPFVAISATKGQTVGRVIGDVIKLRKRSRDIPATGPVNRCLQRAFEQTPPPLRKNRRLKLFYATAAIDPHYATIPVPTYVLFVNDKRLVIDSYRQFLARRLRDEFGIAGIPIVFSFRSRPRKAKGS